MELELNIPASWSEVSIARFQEFQSLDKEGTDVKATIERIAVLTDSDSADIGKLAFKQFEAVVEMLRFCEHEPGQEFRRLIDLDGTVYGLIDLEKITVGEYADLETFVKDGAMANLHRILAMVYRPLTTEPVEGYKTEEYNTDTVEERAELFRDKLTVEDAYGAALFFSLFANELGNSIAHSLKDQMVQEIKTKTR
jgi:hypothetical protein